MAWLGFRYQKLYVRVCASKVDSNLIAASIVNILNWPFQEGLGDAALVILSPTVVIQGTLMEFHILVCFA